MTKKEAADLKEEVLATKEVRRWLAYLGSWTIHGSKDTDDRNNDDQFDPSNTCNPTIHCWPTEVFPETTIDALSSAVCRTPFLYHKMFEEDMVSLSMSVVKLEK